MGQDSYRDQIKFTPGQLVYDSFGKKRTVLNKHPQAKQVDEITVGSGPNDNTTYTISIDGHDISYTTDGSATQDELGQGLADAVNAKNTVSGTVEASFDAGSDVITLTARLEGIGFTYSEVADPSDDLSHTRVTQNATANPIPWGRAVADHGTLGEKLGRLADASNLTAREVRVSLDTYNAGTYEVEVLLPNGEVVRASYSSSGETVDTVLDNLQTDLDASDLLSVNSNTNDDRLEIKPETAGMGSFEIVSANPADGSEFTVSTQTEGDDFTDKMAGVATAGGQLLYEEDVDVGQYQPNEEVDIAEDGAYVVVEVEEQPSRGDPVYVRLSSNGSLDKLGAFRASWNSGCVPLPGAKWVDTRGSDAAAIEVP